MEADRNNQWQNLVHSQKSKSIKDNEVQSPEQITSYIFIFDCLENSILYANPAYEAITGFSTNDFTIDQLIADIHPDDLEYFMKCEELNLEFTNKLLFAEHFNYIMSYSYRRKTASGNYIQIVQECQALEVNNSGHLVKTLVTHKKLDNIRPIDDKDRKIFDKMKGVFVDDNNRYNLSNRELEIISLIKQGMNSQEVADALNVSKNTILTHRKNILSKTKSNSFIELIKKMTYTP